MSDPFGGGFDPQMFAKIPLFQELMKVMSWSGGPVNWDVARDAAVSLATPAGALPANTGTASDFAEAVNVAELWLDQVTSLPAVEGPAVSLTTEQWTRQTTSSAGLGAYLEPVAAGMTMSLGEALPDELAAFAGNLTQQMGGFTAFFYGLSAGQVAGQLAQQMMGAYDLGVPTLDPKIVATVGDNAAKFAAEYDFDAVEFRYWLALREAAHRRMFAGVAWLRPAVAELVGQFASQSTLNINQMLEGFGGMGLDLGSFDPGDPEALRDALAKADAFRVEPSTEQRATLRALQAIVSFVEGYSETVINAAAGDKFPSLARIQEAARRRRAEKGPGERALEQLLGLDLKPGDVRLGPSFCEAVISARGLDALDQAWRSRQWLPRADELADPSRWLVRFAAAEIEAELRRDDDGTGES